MNRFGGYPKEIFVNKVSEALTCGVCLEILKNPKQCNTGHSFCHTCIAKILKTSKKVCPSCQTKLKKLDELSCNFLAKQLIENLTVSCEECSWKGPLHELDNHLHVIIDLGDEVNLALPSALEIAHVEMGEENIIEIVDQTGEDDHLFEPVNTFSEEVIRTTDRTYVGQVQRKRFRRNGPVFSLKHGFGVEFYHDIDGTTHERYSGEFRNGSKHGAGVILSETNDQIKFSGLYARGKKNGIGITYLENGDFFKAKWKKGKFMGKVVEPTLILL